jgi:hypothetical protein
VIRILVNYVIPAVLFAGCLVTFPPPAITSTRSRAHLTNPRTTPAEWLAFAFLAALSLTPVWLLLTGAL